MASRRKRLVNLYITPTSFSSLFKRMSGRKVAEYDFSGISELRQLLSNEKARILYVIKTEKPESLYKLSKILGRDFKSISRDIQVLEKFGFITLKESRKGNRKIITPQVEIDELTITLSF